MLTDHQLTILLIIVLGLDLLQIPFVLIMNRLNRKLVARYTELRDQYKDYESRQNSLFDKSMEVYARTSELCNGRDQTKNKETIKHLANVLAKVLTARVIVPGDSFVTGPDYISPSIALQVSNALKDAEI